VSGDLDEVVRVATIADSAAITALEATAREIVSTMRGGLRLLAESPPVGDWQALVERGDRHVVVGTLDGVIVGYLELEIGDVIAEVRQVYVDPEARELGLGDGMLLHAMDVARHRGCSTIEGTALPGDRGTKNLYERAGITARKITVSRGLVGPPPSEPSTRAAASR